MTAATAVEHFKDFLSEYELSEIFEFKEIWFCPTTLKRSKPEMCLNNNGFDNEKGDYKVVVGDHIQFRYQIVALLGNGSFGQVCKCLDHKTKEYLALKIIKNKKKFHKQGLVEAKLLKTLQENDPKDCKNIVRSIDHFIFRNHICITFELLSINLYELMKVNSFQRLSLSLVCRFAVQILTALDFACQLGIIHCDLKPENILLKSLQKSGIKIIDFGSGCFENERIYTYIQSRFYRAPEIMLGIPYTTKIDIWSAGCILAELYTGRPLFPGETEAEQFCRIMEVLGTPPLEMIEASARKKVFFENSGKPRLVLNGRGRLRIPASKDLQDVICCDDYEFLQFLRKMLTWKPELRPSASDALKHGWIVKNLSKEIGKIRRNSKTFIDTHCI
jgi:dual specificity tyrosine-phosphorylation-regulated kinase 2/3/4